MLPHACDTQRNTYHPGITVCRNHTRCRLAQVRRNSDVLPQALQGLVKRAHGLTTQTPRVGRVNLSSSHGPRSGGSIPPAGASVAALFLLGPEGSACSSAWSSAGSRTGSAAGLPPSRAALVSRLCLCRCSVPVCAQGTRGTHTQASGQRWDLEPYSNATLSIL